jgi:hypothetical protein
MKATKCQCGAVTVEIDGASYSMPVAKFRRLFPGQRAKRGYSTCNYCVNNWGIDLCGCGSGEKFGKCDFELPECKRPAQSIEDCVTGCTTDGGGWGPTGRNRRSPFGMGA